MRGAPKRPRGLSPVGGRRAPEDDLPLRRRMHEAEPCGVQAETADAATGPAVSDVADDRPARLGELHADLVPAPGAEAQLEQAALAPPPQHAVVGDGLAALLGRAHPQHAILRELALQRAPLVGRAALDQRE